MEHATTVMSVACDMVVRKAASHFLVHSPTLVGTLPLFPPAYLLPYSATGVFHSVTVSLAPSSFLPTLSRTDSNFLPTTLIAPGYHSSATYSRLGLVIKTHPSYHVPLPFPHSLLPRNVLCLPATCGLLKANIYKISSVL